MPRVSRRQFLCTASVGVLGGASASANREVQEAARRATAGDVVEPAWERLLTVTVGPVKADLVGSDQRVTQAAIEHVARLGGGTVHLLPGVYRLRNAIRLQTGVRILGSGADSVLIKEAAVGTKLIRNSDWYEREITLADPSGFEVGDGIVLRARGRETRKFTLVARSGNRFRVDQMLTDNYWLDANPSATALFAILDGYRVSDTVVEDICLDGNGVNNEFLNGNYVGCVFLRECNRIALRKVIARNFSGDGLSWQLSHDVRVEDCHCHDNAGFGAHPGSGSKRAVVTGNKLDRNDIGFFFCWGVQWSLGENNTIADSKSSGISLGHTDTDNLIRANKVLRSGETGIRLRQEHGPDFCPDRNRLESNEVLDSGGEEGVGIDIEGHTKSIAVVRNHVRESRGRANRIGVRISGAANDIVVEGNRISGFSTPVLDLRRS